MDKTECRYCKGTGRYRLLDRLVDCDQCDATVTDSGSDGISTLAPGVVAEIRGTIKINLPDDWTAISWRNARPTMSRSDA